MSDSGKLQLERTSGSWGSLNSWKPWLHSYTNPKSKSMIHKILKLNNLYHNPDPLFWLVGEVNESTVLVEGQEARALLGSGSQLSAILLRMGQEIEIKTMATTINFTN